MSGAVLPDSKVSSLMSLVKSLEFPFFWELKGFDFAGVLGTDALYSLRYYDQQDREEFFVLIWEISGEYIQYDTVYGPEMRDLMSQYRRKYRKQRPYLQLEGSNE